MLFDSIDPNKWYSVRETSGIVGWGVDAVRDWIYAGKLQAFIKPGTTTRRKRIYRGARILGSELIRFIREHLTPRK